MSKSKKHLLKFFQSGNNVFWLILILFALIYASIPLVDHYMFRTVCWDYAIRNNMIWHYAHLEAFDCTIKQPAYANYLSNHFTIVTMLVSPLYYLFGSYSLLIFQIVAILVGGWGVYIYFNEYGKTQWFGILAMLHFFAIWGIFSGLAYGYRENIIAAMMIPWLFYFFQKQKWNWALVMFFLILLCKENMALWMVFLMGGLGIGYYKDAGKRNKAFLFSGIALLYFVLVLKIVMPAFDEVGRGFQHFNYQSTLGCNWGEAFHTFLREPGEVIKSFFVNHYPDNNRYDRIKMEFYTMLLVSGGVFFILRPWYLLMIFPLLAMKMLNDDVQKWGINLHYSIEFVPLLTFALFGYANEMPSKQKTLWLAGLFSVFTLAATVITFENRRSVWYNKDRAKFYAKRHYQRNFDVAEMHKALDKKIPNSANVSAHYQLAPHLAFRDTLYQFPTIKNANYIALLDSEKYTYPLFKEEYQVMTRLLKKNEQWEMIHNRNKLYIFRKRGEN